MGSTQYIIVDYINIIVNFKYYTCVFDLFPISYAINSHFKIDLHPTEFVMVSNHLKQYVLIKDISIVSHYFM